MQSNTMPQPSSYTGLYAMHKYWSKKPPNLVARYIEQYSAPQEIVLDSFCGSGVTVVEGVRLNRRAIGIDINPIAIFISQMGLTPVEIEELNRHFAAIKQTLAPKMTQLYQTECVECGYSQAIITHTIWDHDQPQEVWYRCDRCQKNKFIRAGSAYDQQMAFHPPPPKWYPTHSLIPNSRVNVKPNMQIADLFTPRAIVFLSHLFEQIQQIQEKRIRDTLAFCFSAALPQTSNLVFVIRRRRKNPDQKVAQVGSWVVGYWVPKEHFEINAWRCFENRFRRIIRGKQHVNRLLPSKTVPCHCFEELYQAKQGYWLQTGTATQLPIPDNAIDYAFIDPPHGNRIPYLELSLIWNSWFEKEPDWEKEIIISAAKERHKDIDDYQHRLGLAIKELGRVLKPNRFISIAFNTLDDETWLSLLRICLETGFKMVDIQPLAYSARSVVQDSRKNALKTDFIITCQKDISIKGNKITYTHNHSALRTQITQFLSLRGAETYEILNHLLIKTIPTGKIFKISYILKLLEKEFIFAEGYWHPPVSEKERDRG